MTRLVNNLSCDARLVDVLDAYLAALEAGTAPSREALLAQHPELAAALEACLASLDFIQRAAVKSVSVDAQPVCLPPADLATDVLGDYRILREVGRGGMGVVYEAKQISLGRRVALKVLPFAAALDVRQLQRFKNEARAAALLYHPNIVPVYAVGFERGVHYYAMQFIQGQTLAQAIAELRQPALQLQRSSFVPAHPPFFQAVARLGIQAADALEHAHQQGLIHRDIKPSNLLLEGEPGLSVPGVSSPAIRLWLTDFGLARIRRDTMGLTFTGDVIGTLRYMSPEQALAKHGLVDHRTDIYALGATLYELLTLEPVFAGRDREELLRQIAFEKPRPLRRVNRAAPVELDTILGKALAKHPHERYDSAAELADDLRRFLEHRPLTARRPSVADRARVWVRRRQGVVLGTMVILQAALLGLVASGVLLTGDRDEAWRQQDSAERQRVQAEARERTARRYMFDKDVEQAYHALETEQRGRVAELMAGHRGSPDECSTFAWRYLWHQAHPEDVYSLAGHERTAYHVGFSPDGAFLASGGADGRVCLWRAATGVAVANMVVRQGDGRHKRINWVAFSPDGRQVASAGGDGFVRLWAVPRLRRITEFRHPSEVVAVEFSRNGKILLSGAKDGVLRIWDLLTKTQRTTLPGKEPIESLAIAPDGLMAAAAYDGGVRLWDLRRQRVLRTFRVPAPDQPKALGVAFAHHVPLLATSWGDGRARVYNTTTGVLQRTFGGDPGPEGIAYSPDDRWMAGAGPRKSVCVWEAENGALYHRFETNHGYAWSVAFSPDGKSLAAAFEDGSVGLWPSWHESIEREYRTFPASSGRVDGLALSPSGRTLGVLGKDILIRFWDLAGGGKFTIVGYWPHTGHMALSGDSHTFAMVDAGGVNVQLYDCPSGRPTACRSPFGRKPFIDGLTLALTFDGGILATCGHNHGVVRLWDTRAGLSLRLLCTLHGPELDFGQAGPGPTEFSSDGSKLIWSSSNTVCVWDLVSNRLVGKQEGLSYPAFSVNADMLAVPVGGAARILDTRTWQIRAELGHDIRLVALAPNGESLAVCDTEGRVHLWDLQTSQQLFILPRHAGRTEILRFAQDGSALWAVGTTPDKSRAWLATYPAPRIATAPPEEARR